MVPAGLKLFLDTADMQEWERLLPLGIFMGVTTNPVLLQRAGVPCSLHALRDLFQKAVAFPGIREVMFQAWGGDSESLVARGLELAALDRERVVVKLPLTAAGLCAAAELRDSCVRICMTTCYEAKQAFLAAGVGAEYIAPYLGRMSDLALDGPEECATMQAVVRGSGSGTRILVASIRSVDQMTKLAARGLDTFTFSPAICDALLDVPATLQAAEDFEQAAREGSIDAAAS